TGSTIRDHQSHGVLTLAEVIQKSSNVGTVKLAMQMPAREMWELYADLGLGQKPQIDFPGAVTGRLRPYKTWRPIEQATMSYGYGLSASLLQLARAYTVFAHDGELLPVTMLRREQPAQGVRVISPETARQVRHMLELAAGPGGTAPLAQTVGWSVGGKTGTARKQEGKGYASNKYRAWFVGLAPIGEPRIVVAVMIDEPSNGKFYGGAVAAPVFSQVVQQTLRALGVPPDRDVAPQILARDLPAVAESF
ncbi:MAG: penicillin-binding transpeptidase domain-containing protein, partial [Gammaproteobacteria bacterium]